MRGLNGDLRKVFLMYADGLSAIDRNVLGAKYWSSWWPPPGTKQECQEGLAEKLTKRVNADAGQKTASGVETFLKRTEQVLRMKCMPSLWKALMD